MLIFFSLFPYICPKDPHSFLRKGHHHSQIHKDRYQPTINHNLNHNPFTQIFQGPYNEEYQSS